VNCKFCAVSEKEANQMAEQRDPTRLAVGSLHQQVSCRRKLCANLSVGALG